MALLDRLRGGRHSGQMESGGPCLVVGRVCRGTGEVRCKGLAEIDQCEPHMIGDGLRGQGKRLGYLLV